MSLDCPRCGGPADDVPVDSQATLRCPWCGAHYERQSAEEALASLRDEVSDWLERTAGVTVSDGADAVDVATRSFLFNDRILPGLRRDVRRAIDEGVGDVLGSPILVPPTLRNLPGFTGDDCVLLTKREEVLALRSLRGRLEAREVVAFATSAADRIALEKLRRDIDRAQLASHATVAIATEGLTHGVARARHNVEALRKTTQESTIEQSTAPAEAALTRALGLRCDLLMQTFDAIATGVDVAALRTCGEKLEETADWLLSLEERDLRGALASTGLHRDATAIFMLCAVAEVAQDAVLPPMVLIEELHVASELLEHATRPTDAVALIRSWAHQVAAIHAGSALPAVQDIAWVPKAVEQNTRSGEHTSSVDVVFVPYWAMPARHTKAEGLLFKSGKQYEGMALVTASADESGTMLLSNQDYLARWVQHALSSPSPVEQRVDVPWVGPSAARESARKVLRNKDLRNVSLGDPQLVFVPIAVAHFEGSAAPRTAALTLMGPVAHDPDAIHGRAALLERVAASIP